MSSEVGLCKWGIVSFGLDCELFVLDGGVQGWSEIKGENQKGVKKSIGLG